MKTFPKPFSRPNISNLIEQRGRGEHGRQTIIARTTGVDLGFCLGGLFVYCSLSRSQSQ